MFPKGNEPWTVTVTDIIKNQLVYFHGPERAKYRNIPKIMDLCLSKLTQLIQGNHYTCEEIIDCFTLSTNVKQKFKFDKELESLKQAINNGYWDSLIQSSSEPKIIAQLFLDFCEQLSEPVISVHHLQEVDTVFQQSFSKYEEGQEKRALHEIFEDDVRVNKKKVTFTTICRVVNFLLLFSD